MSQTLHAIVLTSMRYGEKAKIVRVLSREEGMLSFVIYTERSKKKASRSALFMPFMSLEMEVKLSTKSDLHAVREATIDIPFIHLHQDPSKSAQIMFLSELIAKSMHEGEANEQLFDYLTASIQWLDTAEGSSSFHVAMMLGLSRLWGFDPQPTQYTGFLDMREGLFCGQRPHHPDFVEGSAAELLERLYGMDLDAVCRTELSREERNGVVDDMLRYYQIQLEHFKKLNSHLILQETFD